MHCSGPFSLRRRDLGMRCIVSQIFNSFQIADLHSAIPPFFVIYPKKRWEPILAKQLPSSAGDRSPVLDTKLWFIKLTLSSETSERRATFGRRCSAFASSARKVHLLCNSFMRTTRLPSALRLSGDWCWSPALPCRGLASHSSRAALPT